MQRDDQWMVNYYKRVAMKAAERHLLVDFHGAYKPTGLHRTYPNVISYEGVRGLEWSKWSRQAEPEHNLQIRSCACWRARWIIRPAPCATPHKGPSRRSFPCRRRWVRDAINWGCT